jgi:3-oxoacyl-[acyl-carrier protein] reductase
MDLQLSKKLFLVGGATAGFGNAVATALIHEGATVIAVARNNDNLAQFRAQYPDQVEAINGDITQPETLTAIEKQIGNRPLSGLLINAGGPPAKKALETELSDWDEAWRSLVRWKIDLVLRLLPKLRNEQYGRIVFVESVSVKQPVENLVLSNSLRMAIVGFAKSLSQEIGKEGITVNVMAPGYHDTHAVKRVLQKKSEVAGLPYDAIRSNLEKNIPVGRMGQPHEFASLALWLLSPLSGYVTGQTISVDGGVMAGSFG